MHTPLCFLMLLLIGKSTLLNIILDKLNPVSGSVKRNSHLRMASFTQHHAEQCDYRKTAIENMMARFVGSHEQVCIYN